MEKTKKNKFGWWDLFRLACLAVSIVLCSGGCFLIRYFWIDLGISLEKGAVHSVSQLVILPWFVVAYCLVELIVVCFAALKKGGFKNLKSWNEKGVIYWLIAGFIVGLLVWFITAFICWFIVWVVSGIIAGIFAGLISGIFAGLFAGLIDGFKE